MFPHSSVWWLRKRHWGSFRTFRMLLELLWSSPSPLLTMFQHCWKKAVVNLSISDPYELPKAKDFSPAHSASSFYSMNFYRISTLYPYFWSQYWSPSPFCSPAVNPNSPATCFPCFKSPPSPTPIVPAHSLSSSLLSMFEQVEQRRPCRTQPSDHPSKLESWGFPLDSANGASSLCPRPAGHVLLLNHCSVDAPYVDVWKHGALLGYQGNQQLQKVLHVSENLTTF